MRCLFLLLVLALLPACKKDACRDLTAYTYRSSRLVNGKPPEGGQ